ncbi:GNAT family N-acetyltransferase [Pseudomonas fluorescens]|uniref:GNAT family acetyltransferase n=1 Tax=Pseudomonas fluorescens TaxID=294 RepID=A0A0F4TI88_PSEFL|nr:GNAT family N-acetyltransferase [Pseudomonas fluorescens]KJZ43784.1 GNAT family acetyltransferase [Pseudomonas fluorescens]
MNFTIRRAQLADAAALPAIERSAAELFRCDPSLAWLADAQVTDAEQHQRAIETDEVWVTQSLDGVLMGFLSAVEVDNELHIQELSVRQRFQGRGAGRKLLLTAVEYARDRELYGLTLTTFRDLPWNEPFYQGMGFETLSPAQLGPRLATVLNDEAAHGLPGERRCAMRLRLRAAPSNQPPTPGQTP